MARLTPAIRVLGLDRSKWSRLGPDSLWVGAVFAVAASALIAIGRFGGLVVDAPRGFVRLTLVGVWGWLGLSLALWLLAAYGPFLTAGHARRRSQVSLRHTVTVVGYAHTSLLVLGLVIFVAANLFQLFGPGLAAAVFAIAFWFPALLTTAIRHTHQLSHPMATAVVAIAYPAWLLVIGRHLLGQIQHLL